MKALVSGGSGFKLLSRVLIMMLQTLLQDRLAEVSSLMQYCFSLSINLTELASNVLIGWAARPSLRFLYRSLQGRDYDDDDDDDYM